MNKLSKSYESKKEKEISKINSKNDIREKNAMEQDKNCIPDTEDHICLKDECSKCGCDGPFEKKVLEADEVTKIMWICPDCEEIVQENELL